MKALNDLDHYVNLEGINTDYLKELDSKLHKLWGLGRNMILQWTPQERGIAVLVIPHYILSEFVSKNEILAEAGKSADNIIEDVISGPRMTSFDELINIASELGFDIQHVDLPFRVGEDVPSDAVEAMIKRYSISYVDDRAVALFDIVGFSLYSTLDQVTQLNSLAYSMNAAYSKMLDNNVEINFARSTTGDGFYIWNRERSMQANINLYHFMHLVLADNAIASSKAYKNTTPVLRTAFHVGGHYEFYQAEGIDPTIYSYIVGDVTIDLARMIDRAEPGQIIVGDFSVPMPDKKTNQIIKAGTVQFIEQAQGALSSLEGLVLSDEHINSIKCYLTGDKMDDKKFGVRRYIISDKHEQIRSVYNAKVNIYRGKAAPIYLGLQTRDLESFHSIRFEFVETPNF